MNTDYINTEQADDQNEDEINVPNTKRSSFMDILQRDQSFIYYYFLIKKC